MSFNSLAIGLSAAALFASGCSDSYDNMSAHYEQQALAVAALESEIMADGFDSAVINNGRIDTFQGEAGATVRYGRCILQVTFNFEIGTDNTYSAGSYTFEPYGSDDFRIQVEDASQISQTVQNVVCKA